MSNGESKIAESKAALCCGFAIALRALFLGILCLLIASLALAMTHLYPLAKEGKWQNGSTISSAHKTPKMTQFFSKTSAGGGIEYSITSERRNIRWIWVR